DLAVYICKCRTALICIFDPELQLQTGISCPNQLTQLLSRRELHLKEVQAIDTDSLKKNLGIETALDEDIFSYLTVVPLINSAGELIGALCLTDQEAIILDNQQKKALLLLAKQLSSKLINTRNSEQLKASLTKAEKFHDLFNQSSEIHCITDLEGRIEYINDSVYWLLGYAPQETAGKTIWDFCAPGERERLRPEIYAELGRGADRFRVETRTLTKSGELRWFEWSDVVKQDHWLINGRDITDRKRAELEARILGTAMERASAAVFIRDINLEITWINDAAIKLMGYTLEEVKGKPFGNLLVGPDTDIAVCQQAARMIEEGEPYEMEVQLYKKDGSPVWLFISTSFVLDQAGNAERIVSVAFDITARKQVELEARVLSTAVERTSAAVFIRNTNLEITWINSAAEVLMGYSLEELQGKTFISAFAGPDTDTSIYAYAARMVKQKLPYEIEVLFYKKDGSPVWLSFSNSSVYNQAGQMERVVCVAFDITARKEAEAQILKTRDEAIKLSRAKESFLSVMSHEMRTPLNAVIGMSRILLEEEHLPGQQEHLDILGFSAQNLLTLINDVLDFTKIETGNMVLESRPVDLEQLLHNTVQSLKPKAREQGIGLFYEIAPGMPLQVYADQTRLYQILMNLAGNAVKFTSSGYVKVSLYLLEQSEQEIKIGFAVSDTGIGIASNKLETIFDAYTQAGSDISRKYGGTGLGLAITQKLVTLYSSEIKVQSELGKGTTFAFNITFKKASSAQTEAATAENDQALWGHVLVVDDSSVNRLVAGKILHKWGLTTDFAENGAEALEKIKTNTYILVLMDIHMPVMNGLQAAALIRAEPETYYQHLPILALTGSIQDQEQQLIETNGMNGYILKPFDTGELYRKIKELLY
ncbi:MAG: PAS domain-containing sensor histidine kinase, partial [Sphingobacteriaceae bacterium]